MQMLRKYWVKIGCKIIYQTCMTEFILSKILPRFLLNQYNFYRWISNEEILFATLTFDFSALFFYEYRYKLDFTNLKFFI